MTQFRDKSASLRNLPRPDREGGRCCPFWENKGQVCRATIRMLLPAEKQIYRYCCGDDHDDCAYFLSRALRSSRTQGGPRDAFSEGEK